jgi:ribosome-associated protein
MSTEENSIIKEQSLHPEQSAKRTGSSSTATEPVSADDVDERLHRALLAASDKKAMDLVVLDLRSLASFTDFFAIASGTSARQVQAIADGVVEQLKKGGDRAARIEGYKSAEWILVDYGDFIFHIFEDKARRFYDLERLWREAAKVTLPADVAGSESSMRID